MKRDKIIPGQHFNEAIELLKLTDEERAGTTDSTEAILEKIIENYEKAFSGEAGEGGTSDTKLKADTMPVGLLYGRIQSGKTRAMILSTAMALDNGFRIIVVLTSNNNKLVDQTHQDFIGGLPGVKIYSKDEIQGSSLDAEAQHIHDALKHDDSFGVVIVSSKGTTVLRQVVEFLEKIRAAGYPSIVFDDEGDQATLDTNRAKRTSKDPATPFSPTHSLVHNSEDASLRSAMPKNIFVSVTGTPQGIFLQSAGSNSRPSFVHILEAGKAYVGGAVFFGKESASDVPYINLVDDEEGIQLLGSGLGVPEGLRDAICFYVVAAAAAGINNGWREYKMLCHPSSKMNDHESVKTLVAEYIGTVISSIQEPAKAASVPVLAKLKKAYDELGKTETKPPEFELILEEAKKHLLSRRISIINTTTTNVDIHYDKYYNILIGGNTVGRGLAISNLLVTYYTREPKRSTMDTMYQHARMFGYRQTTLPYTRVFLPQQLYRRFHEIYKSDEEARDYIRKSGLGPDGGLLIRVEPGVGLKPTKANVLDAARTRVLHPGRQIYPNYPHYEPEKVRTVNKKIAAMLGRLLEGYDGTKECSALISLEDAIAIATTIRTRSDNTWIDRQVGNYLTTFANQLKIEEVWLKFRPTERNPSPGGYLGNAILAGDRLKEAREKDKPTLWVFKVDGRGWAGEDFFYPTIVAPNKLTSFIFNNS